jgi:hypothetical protein
MSKLTDLKLRAWLKKRPPQRFAEPDGTVPGLSLRVGPYTMTWSLKLRVTGEGGVSQRGHQKKGKTCRITLGEYPDVTLDSARGTARTYWDQAKKGVSPVTALEGAATAGGSWDGRQTTITSQIPGTLRRALIVVSWCWTLHESS